MTTLAAALGALPLAIGFGEGAELRRPLGVAIIGGLIASQLLTLLTTPVVYVLLDKLRRRSADAAVAPRRRALAAGGERHDALRTSRRSLLALVAALAGCAVGPDYERPSAPVPAAYKEAPRRPARPGCRPRRPTRSTAATGGACSATPSSTGSRRGSRSSNQNVAAAVAAYARRRRWSARRARRCFPTLGSDGERAPQRRRRRRRRPQANAFAVSLGADWEPDLWGRLGRARRERAARARRRAPPTSPSARLSAQGELAINYFSLREADAEVGAAGAHDRGLRARAADHAEPLRRRHRAEDRRAAGRRPSSPTTRADLAALRASRARFEHAIAVLVGKAPGDFALAAGAVDAGRAGRSRSACRRTLLQRRPDIASAERQVAAANAQIGIAALGLLSRASSLERHRSAAAQSRLGDLFSASSALWSLGVSVAQTVFDAGATRGARRGRRGRRATRRSRATGRRCWPRSRASRTSSRPRARWPSRPSCAARRRTPPTRPSSRSSTATAPARWATPRSSPRRRRRCRRGARWCRSAVNRQVSAIALIQALGGGWERIETP